MQGSGALVVVAVHPAAHGPSIAAQLRRGQPSPEDEGLERLQRP
jgi:hypothetical protein